MVVGTFREFQNQVQSVLDNNEDALQAYGITPEVQLKTYLIESPIRVGDAVAHIGQARPLDVPHWYRVDGVDQSGVLFIENSLGRVWRVFSLLPASDSDALIERWIRATHGLDYCWLSRPQLMRWESEPGWTQRGVGMYFNDGLSPEEQAGNFSLKAWHGANRLLAGLSEVIERAKQSFAISSVRWERREAGVTTLSAESYSFGKLTVNRAVDVDHALLFSSALADQYNRSLVEAGTLRDSSMAPFEFEFSQAVNLDAFEGVVSKGAGSMRLWLTKVEDAGQFRRFRGVDLHTWDRIFLDLTPNWAYLTIPSSGCVNAAPRIATIQGEDNSGNTRVSVDGVEMFA